MDKKTNTTTDKKVGGVDGEVGKNDKKLLGVLVAVSLLAASFAIGRFTAPTIVEVIEPAVIEVIIEEGTEAVDEVVPEIVEEVEPVVVPTL